MAIVGGGCCLPFFIKFNEVAQSQRFHIVVVEKEAQLQQFLRIQEKEWDYYKCLAASVYAMRQLGYVRRACSVTDITRWLSEQLVNDYTDKNRRDLFRKAWNELGRYSDDVKHFVNVLNQLGVYSCS